MFRLPFKPNKPKQFNYKPLYYNERKEQLEQRIDYIKRDVEFEKSRNKNKIRTQFNDSWGRDYRKSAHNQSNKRIIIIAGILTVLLYFLLK